VLLGHNKYESTLFAIFLSPSASGRIQSLDFWIMCLASYHIATVKGNKKIITNISGPSTSTTSSTTGTTTTTTGGKKLLKT